MKRDRTAKQCEAILRHVIELMNKHDTVLFHKDFGGNTMTVYAGGRHYHCGTPDGAFARCIEHLYHHLERDCATSS